MALRVLFMGTPEFAAVQLRALWEQKEELDLSVVGAVCQPDKPRGRGKQLLPCAVKAYAQSVGIPVFQPQTLRDEAFAALLRECDPELIVVAAYGKLLPESVLQYPRLGCINVLGSLLPHYRGAAPIQRAVMNGDSETGVTIMFMEKGMDTGAMLAKSAFSITPQDTYGTVHDRMAAQGAALLPGVIRALRQGRADPKPQDGARATYAPKIEKEECFLDFSKSAEVLHNQIRGLSPAPLACAYLHSKKGAQRMKIAAAQVIPAKEGVPAGTVFLSGDKPCVMCGRDALLLCRVVPQGKAEMDGAAYARGRGIAPGDRLSQTEEENG